MFSKLTKAFVQETAPSTVVPHCMPKYRVKEMYGLETVYKLASNENPFGVSPKAQAAMHAAVAECYQYSDGSREKVLSAKIAAYNGVNPENIFISGGAASVLSLIADVFIQPGDEVIIPSPAYPPYYFWAFKNGGTIIDVPCRAEDQLMDSEGILQAISDRTKLIFLCNPNNPTSTSLSGAQMVDLIGRLPKDVIVVADEAYIDFSDHPAEQTMIPLLPDFPQMIVVRTFSKIYGMASARMGYAVSCKEINAYMEKAVSARGVTLFGVEGAIAALDDEQFRVKTIENNTVERLYLTHELTSMGYQVAKSQANFLWVDFGRPAGEIHDDLLPYGVIIRGDFGSRARISIGLHKENEMVINALREIEQRSK